jgi:hypothetical protein
MYEESSLIPQKRLKKKKLNLVQIVDAPKQIFWGVYVVVIATHYLPGLSSYFRNACHIYR